MKNKFKKFITTVIASSVLITAILPMSASAYYGTYVGSFTKDQTTDMGYHTRSNLVVYSHEVNGKTSVVSGYPTFTYARIWGCYKKNNTLKQIALSEQYGDGGINAHYANSSYTFTGGASYHFISSEDDTNTKIRVGNFPSSYKLEVSPKFKKEFY